MANKALIVSTNKFPQGDAGAIREEAFARLFQNIGFDVVVVGLGKTTNLKFSEYQGIKYISLRGKGNGIISRIINRIHYSRRLRRYVLSDKEGFDCILFVNGSKQTIDVIKKYKKNNRCVLLHDSVEWYSPEEFKLGVLSRPYRNKNKLNTILINEDFKVIAISRYLESYFNNRGIITKRIPVIMDIKSIPTNKELDPEKVTFLYAGTPGRKDYLSGIIEAFAKLTKEEKSKCKLIIIGITRDQLRHSCGVALDNINSMEYCMTCMGKVPHEEVLRQLSKVDFTVLLRKSDQRYSKAGFPTKFVESLATGTPVICNLSSDLELYMENENNGLICDDCSSESMLKCLRKAIQLTLDKREEMQKYSRNVAELYFDFRIYSSLMREIIYES